LTLRVVKRETARMGRPRKWAKVPIEEAREAGLAPPPEDAPAELPELPELPPAASSPPEAEGSPEGSPEGETSEGEPAAEVVTQELGDDEPPPPPPPPSGPRAGSGPRPRRSHKAKTAPPPPPAPPPDPRASMVQAIAQAVHLLGLGLAASVDDCWRLKPDECSALAGPIVRLLPDQELTPAQELALVASMIALPRLVVTLQNRRARQADARRAGIHAVRMEGDPPPPVPPPAPPPAAAAVVTVVPSPAPSSPRGGGYAPVFG
jgi:hypothetical protein